VLRVSAAKLRAQWVRGGLVATCATLLTTGAHVVAGGSIPHGAPLVMAALISLTVGVLLAKVSLPGRRDGVLANIVALGLTQFVGHLTLSVFACGHTSGHLSSAMVATHVAAAVLLGVLINLVEYLYTVCASVRSWLRLFTVASPRPHARSASFLEDVVAIMVLRCAGLGMRAPPMEFA
jgi:hypothetical protein